jgi:hypothetical protein
MYKYILLPFFVFIMFSAQGQTCLPAWTTNNGQGAWNSPGAYVDGSVAERGGENWTCGTGQAFNCNSTYPGQFGGVWINNVACTSASAPSITNGTTANITCTSIDVNGNNVTSDGGASITERGVVYATTSNPTLSDSKITASGTTGSYDVTVSGLNINTLYYFRAYATNSVGTTYGNEVSSSTLNCATVVTGTSASVSCTAFTVNNNEVTAEGSSSVTERGIVYHTSSNPTIANNKVTSGSGLGTYNITVNSGLTGSTLYYVRAFATNTQGTTYGSEIQITTVPSVATTATVASTTAASNINCNSATSGGNITCDGGSTITERGVVYATSSNPTTANTKVIVAGTTGSFVANLTGLSANTTYYVRAYAINGQGTSYATQVSFNTGACTCDPNYTVYYSCATKDQWTTNSDGVTGCGAAPGGSSWTGIIRNDWLNPSYLNADGESDADNLPYHWALPSPLPNEIFIENGGKAVTPYLPNGTLGTRLCMTSGAFFGYDGSFVTGSSGNEFQVIENDGRLLVRGSFNNNIAVTGSGRFCVTGNWENNPGGSVRGFSGDMTTQYNATHYGTTKCIAELSVLPVDLLEFSGIIIEHKKHLLIWKTGSEINNDYFELERSVDGLNYEIVTRVKGKNNSTILQSYSFIDYINKNQESIYFYRLKQVDIDGNYSFSNSVKFIYTNSSKLIDHGSSGRFTFFAENKGDYTSKVYDNNGKLVFEKSFHLENSQTFEFELNLAKGLYYIVIFNGSVKEIKQKIILH